MSGIKVGVTCSPEYLDALPWVEELGVDSVWTGEHILFHGPTPDATVALGAFAAVTRRVQIGAAVVLLPLRPAVITAKAIAMADVISGGRVLAGVGVGGEFPKEFEAAGVPINERGARADDAIRVLKKLWREENVSHHSRFTHLDGVTLKPKPPSPGGPPIIVAGRSPAAMRRAALLGDGYMPYLLTPERYAQAKATIEGLAAAAGRDLAGFHWTMYQFVSVDADPAVALERAGARLSRQYQQDFSALADRYTASGTPEQVIDRLRAFVAAGVRHLILIPIAPPDAYLAHVDLYARELLPALRAEKETP